MTSRMTSARRNRSLTEIVRSREVTNSGVRSSNVTPNDAVVAPSFGPRTKPGSERPGEKKLRNLSLREPLEDATLRGDGERYPQNLVYVALAGSPTFRTSA